MLFINAVHARALFLKGTPMSLIWTKNDQITISKMIRGIVKEMSWN